MGFGKIEKIMILTGIAYSVIGTVAILEYINGGAVLLLSGIAIVGVVVISRILSI